MPQTAEGVDRGPVYECAMCRAPATRSEKNGLSYCDTHWRKVHPQRVRRLVRSVRSTRSRSRRGPAVAAD